MQKKNSPLRNEFHVFFMPRKSLNSSAFQVQTDSYSTTNAHTNSWQLSNSWQISLRIVYI